MGRTAGRAADPADAPRPLPRPPGRPHPPVRRRPAGPAGRRPPEPHPARHRGAARPRPRCLPPRLRGGVMTDAYDALPLPVTPADPDPAFAADLRSRVERALALPRG